MAYRLISLGNLHMKKMANTETAGQWEKECPLLVLCGYVPALSDQSGLTSCTTP
jgi:hypothetical protein